MPPLSGIGGPTKNNEIFQNKKKIFQLWLHNAASWRGQAFLSQLLIQLQTETK